LNGAQIPGHRRLLSIPGRIDFTRASPSESVADL
jgi:hypothetical protein